MSKSVPTNGFEWTGPKEFDLNKYTSNSWKGCDLDVDVEYPKELRELHNDYLLAPDIMQIKGDYCPNINNWFLVFPIGNIKKLVSNFFDNEKYLLYYENVTLFETRIKTKKIRRVLEFNQLQWLKPWKNRNIKNMKVMTEKHCTT